MREVLLNYSRDYHRASTPACHDAAMARCLAGMERLETERLPEPEYDAHRSLEALRLEDPATMFGCWNPGCETCACM